MAILSQQAPAKLNLSLKVVGRRADGYHLLDSIFLPLLSLCDIVSIDTEAAEQGVMSFCNHPDLTDSSVNLTSIAAVKYAEVTGLSPHWRIDVDKKIPLGGGLGGGSSDAAAVLNLLNGHYRKLDAVALAALAGSIGADVPFFLVSRPARVGGIGEVIEPLHLGMTLYLVLIFSGFPVPTPWAYRQLDPLKIGPDPSHLIDKISLGLQSDDIMTVCSSLHNDLGFALQKKFPLYPLMMENMRKYGAIGTGITGSGSTFFGLTENAQKQQFLFSQLNKMAEAAGFRAEKVTVTP